LWTQFVLFIYEPDDAIPNVAYWRIAEKPGSYAWTKFKAFSLHIITKIEIASASACCSPDKFLEQRYVLTSFVWILVLPL